MLRMPAVAGPAVGAPGIIVATQVSASRAVTPPLQRWAGESPRRAAAAAAGNAGLHCATGSLAGVALSVLAPALTRARQRRRPSIRLAAQNARAGSSPEEVVRMASLGASEGLKTKEVLAAMESLEEAPRPAKQAVVEGTYELVFTSALAGVPFLDGFMPTREILTFDFEQKREMSLVVETLPFLPPVTVIGEKCSFDEAAGLIKYTVKGKDKESVWRVIYADEDVLAARSNVTGLNIARRIRETT